ncbi:hypothetical protein [Nocardioides ochotonae]|nr:hypothetical protein [Nocardioides ochotonae]
MVVALIALGGGLAAAACGSAADAMPRAARAYRRTGLVVGYLSLLLVVSETAVIALAVILGYATG